MPRMSTKSSRRSLQAKASLSSIRSYTSFKPRRKRKIKPVKKSAVARVASTLRRRRSAFRDRYEKAVIQLLEKHDKVPKQGHDGLLYHVQHVPNGHSRESVIQSFDAVVELMSGDSSGKSTVTAKTSRKSTGSPDSREHSTGLPVDLLSDDFFGPDDFDRYLGCDCLKPLPAIANRHSVQGHTYSDLPERPASQEVLIQLDIDSPTLPYSATLPPDLSNSRPPSVDELFFGDSIRLSVRSLISPPSSPPGSPGYSDVRRPQKPRCISNLRPQYSDEIFVNELVQVTVQQSLIPSPPKSKPRDLGVSFFEDLCPEPLSVHKTQVHFHQHTNASNQHSSTVGLHTVTRRQGGEDLRIQANIQLTVTAPTPEVSPQPRRIETASTTPTSLQSGYRIPRKPLPSAPTRQKAEKWRNHSPSTESGLSYQPYCPSPRSDVPSLPLIPSFSSISLMDEMNEELEKLMQEWEAEVFMLSELPTSPSSHPDRPKPLIDIAREEAAQEFAIPSPTEQVQTIRSQHIDSLNVDADLFTNITSLLFQSIESPPSKHINDEFELSMKKGRATTSKSLTPSLPVQPTTKSGADDPLDELLVEFNDHQPELAQEPAPRIPYMPYIPPIIKRPRSVNYSKSRQPIQPRAPVVPMRSSSKYSDAQPASVSFSPVKPVATTEARKPLPELTPPSLSLATAKSKPLSASTGVSMTPAQPASVASKPPSSPKWLSASPAKPTNATVKTLLAVPSNSGPSTAATSVLSSRQPSFKDRMTKATVNALLEADSQVDFDRAWSTIKKTKRSESLKAENSEFEWQRWVDREYVDEARKTVRERRMARKRKRGVTDVDILVGAAAMGGNGEIPAAEVCCSDHKAVRRRSNVFEVLEEEGR